MARVKPAACVLRRRPPNVIFLVALLAACGEGHAAFADSARADSVARAAQDSINRAQPGYVIDSILPIEEQLRRFRVGLDTAHVLEHGVASANELVSAVVSSIARSDTTTLVRLTISRPEFAWLLYPESPLSAPPYRQAPEIAWLQHVLSSESGLSRLLAKLGGHPITLEHWRCAPDVKSEGKNRIWGGCVVRFRDAGTETELQLFSSIIEREGRFKVLSFANAF